MKLQKQTRETRRKFDERYMVPGGTGRMHPLQAALMKKAGNAKKQGKNC